MEIRIGGISNFYGGLVVKKENDKFWWSITNYDGDDWEEIPESLYLELIKFDTAQNEPPRAIV